MNLRATLLLLLVLLSGTAPARADTPPAFAIQYVNTPRAIAVRLETDTSLIVISGTAPREVRWVWIEVTKTGGNQPPLRQQFAAPSYGSFSKKIYLPYGEGAYSYAVLGSVEYEQFTPYYRFFEGQAYNHDTRDLSYLLPTEKIQSDDPELVALAEKIIKGAKSDREKAQALHDWVASHIAYDTASYFSNSWTETSALETLELKKGLCSGYADLTAALHRAVGIRAKIIKGLSSQPERGVTWEKVMQNEDQYRHAWNAVWVDGKWLTLDTTWDAGALHDDKQFHFRLAQTYFDPAADFFSLTHRATEESPF